MESRTHYFVFKHQQYWVEVVASTNKKAQDKMIEMYGPTWERHFNEYNFAWHSRKYPQGCHARYEVD